ncbi:hypothetical protein CE91St46_05930 [Eubacteriales bacterium]|nr:hypothetical protein CE91St46_05930 [Eubacteriales bacterium]GKH62123.1 hypothetical protein CE91St47_05920 [Eubacteriales bacterium]
MPSRKVIDEIWKRRIAVLRTAAGDDCDRIQLRHDKNILPPGAEGIECAVVSGAEGANPPLLNWAAYGESMGREAAEKGAGRLLTIRRLRKEDFPRR